jgi:uncharacterized cupin superfamily protein
MVPEAKLVETEHGLVPEGEGWFVLNAQEARWFRGDAFGAAVTFEGEARFPEVGINIHVIDPGQPNCMYHRESVQEGFLVLSGECLLLVEGEERRLRAWDFFHCPAGVNHVFVGAGDGPCAILMIGARPDKSIVYPVDEVATRHRACVEQETPEPREAYAKYERPQPARYREGDLAVPEVVSGG